MTATATIVTVDDDETTRRHGERPARFQSGSDLSHGSVHSRYSLPVRNTVHADDPEPTADAGTVFEFHGVGRATPTAVFPEQTA